VLKLIVQTLTFSECDGHEPILTSVLSTAKILDSEEWRASRVEFDINGHQRHQSSSTGRQKHFEGKSTSRLSVGFCRANLACLLRCLRSRY